MSHATLPAAAAAPSVADVWLEEGCTLCGLCALICPEVFEATWDAVAIRAEADPAAHPECVREAAGACPMGAIHLTRRLR